MKLFVCQYDSFSAPTNTYGMPQFYVVAESLVEAAVKAAAFQRDNATIVKKVYNVTETQRMVKV